MPQMPQVGILYPHISGRGFITMHVGLNGMIAARIMADHFDVGFVSDPMTAEQFWSLVDDTD